MASHTHWHSAYLPQLCLFYLSLLLILGLVCHLEAASPSAGSRAHTNNWAVLVDSSCGWVNYRHAANALSFYRSVKRLGIRDSNIILMLADQIPCNARNPKPATIYGDREHSENLFPADVEVDYRGDEVTPEAIMRLLTGAVPPHTPRNKQLLTNSQSNVLIYLTGHGADGYLKFQGADHLSNVQLAQGIAMMHAQLRYNELFLIIDSCNSESMYQELFSPNVLAMSSCLSSEKSYSHGYDPSIGVDMTDNFAFHATTFLESHVKSPGSNVSIDEFVQACSFVDARSTIGLRTDLYPRDLKTTPITDFFGAHVYVKAIHPGNLRYGTPEDMEFLERKREENQEKRRKAGQMSEL